MNVAVTKTAAAARATNLAQVGRLIDPRSACRPCAEGSSRFWCSSSVDPWLRWLGTTSWSNISVHVLSCRGGRHTVWRWGALRRSVRLRSSHLFEASSALRSWSSAPSWDGVSGAVAGWSIGECVAAAYSVLALTRCCHRLGVRMSRAGTRDVGAPWRIGLPALAANVAVVFALALGQRLLAEQPLGY